jgi:proteasome assembly chaperone 2
MAIEEKLFYPFPPTAPTPQFKGSTLLVPSVSVGNVPQLTCDLLIATLKLPLVGYLHSPHIYPAVGTKEGSTSQGHGIACPLEGTSLTPLFRHLRLGVVELTGEVYFDKQKELCVILQRTPYLSSSVKFDFVRELWNFTSCFGFASVCLLASSDAARRTDEQIQG